MNKISIIVPVYNTEKYLKKCLDSLVNQTLNNYEIIIINDGSTDKSQEIINKYMEKYPKLIKSYIKKNGGLSSARNYGIKKSGGDYLLFVDSDDYIELNTIEVLTKNIKNNDIIVFNYNRVENTEKFIVKTYNDNIDDKVKKYIVSSPSSCNKLIRKEILTKNKLFFKEGIYYEDLNLMPTLIKYTNNIEFIKDILYNYVVRVESITNKMTFNTKMDDIFLVLDNVYNELSNKYEKEVEYLYIEHLLRYAGLRYLDYKKYDTLEKIVNIVKNKYDKWYKNNYFRQNYSIKQKIMSYLIYKKKYKLINILRK